MLAICSCMVLTAGLYDNVESGLVKKLCAGVVWYGIIALWVLLNRV